MAELTDTQREALESACLEGLVWTEHGYRYRPNVGAEAVERLLPDIVGEHVERILADRLAVAEQESDTRAERIKRGLGGELTRARAQRDVERSRADAAQQEAATLRAHVAAVEALAEHWATDPHSLLGIRNAAAHDLRAALGDSAQWVDRLKAEGAREVLDKVQAVYDTQCPVGPERNFVAGARMAHQWWETVLGGLLDDERARVLRDGGDHG